MAQPSIDVDITIASSFLGAIFVWTGIVFGFTYWLNNKLNLLMSVADYQKQHLELERRVRNLEIHMASLSSQEDMPEFHLPK